MRGETAAAAGERGAKWCERSGVRPAASASGLRSRRLSEAAAAARAYAPGKISTVGAWQSIIHERRARAGAGGGGTLSMAANPPGGGAAAPKRGVRAEVRSSSTNAPAAANLSLAS